MFHEIPTQRPSTPLLDKIDFPADLRLLAPTDLASLSQELRHFLLYTLGRTGGHLGAGLGVVELTIALHYVFDTPRDKLIWDVGHQTYPHKILTGRRERMHLLRQPQGLAPFPTREESEFDVFGVGHSSTSISAALGIALAEALQSPASSPQEAEHPPAQHNPAKHTLVVIGDGAMTAGIAFEALNHLASTGANLLILLNDNAMSISENVGGLARYFARGTSSQDVSSQDVSSQDISSQRISSQQEDPSKALIPGSIFRDLGYDYSGPIDGHDLEVLLDTLGQLKKQSGPRLLHLLTTKGKGFAAAESAPVASHSLGTKLLTKVEKAPPGKPAPTYSSLFGSWACRQAEADPRLVMITPAMKEGSGLVEFAERFPTRFHDVAIAEQHAVTLAAGLAAGAAKPVVAIYSTFLQRAYDQLLHDVALQNLDLLFAVDRASLLEDGPTHSGVFDLSFARALPHLLLMAPADAREMQLMLDLGYAYEGPALVRYPRGSAAEPWPASGADASSLNKMSLDKLSLGKSRQLRPGKRVAILSFGALGATALQVAQKNNYTLVDMRFVKPLDAERVADLCLHHVLLVTLEENVIMGGAGSGVNELVAQRGLMVGLLNLGIPDRFILQDKPEKMLAACGLDEAGIESAIHARLRAMKK